jgi:hypothetical protein
MNAVKILFALLVAALFAVPAGVAQDPPTVKPALEGSGCAELENCDPQQANQEAWGQSMILDTDGKAAVRMILFAHFQDLLQRAPLNTQEPQAEREPDLDRGFLMPTIYVEDQGGQQAPCCKFNNNRFLMFSSPGFVEYLQEGNWRVHQEPGLAADVEIHGDTVWGYWYMSPSNVPDSLPVSGTAPGVIPAVGVYMKMNLGRFESDESSRIIAEGDTGSGFGSPDSAGQCGDCVTMISTPGQDEVWEFKVPMKVSKSVIPSVWDETVSEKDHGYVVRAIPYQLETEQGRVTQADWRLRTGIDYPPRLVLDIKNPMVTTSTRAHLFDDYLFFRWSFTSPWGSYDVDANSLMLEVEGPKNLGPGDIEFVNLKHSVDHDGHFKPLNATWRYDYVNNPLPPGKYTIKAMVHNYQNTYMKTWTEEFTVNDKGIPELESIGAVGGSGGRAQGGADGGDSPGFEAVGLLAVFAAMAFVAQRRRRD